VRKFLAGGDLVHPHSLDEVRRGGSRVSGAEDDDAVAARVLVLVLVHFLLLSARSEPVSGLVTLLEPGSSPIPDRSAI
jgi:hypothetical protein